MKQHLNGARLAAATLIATGLSSAALAQTSRGVNPADIDSRFDVIVKRINLDPDGHADSLTLKYDYKLNQNWGLNFELPAYSRLVSPGLRVTGTGDLFARARWIVPAGTWTYGASFEVVLPTASKDALGTGRNQLNASVLAVRPYSSSFIAAFAAKQTTSVGGDSDRAKFSNSEVRFVPVFILDGGWAVIGELRQTWEHRSDASWQRVEVVLNKQFTSTWAGSLGYGHDFGDRKDRGALSAAVKYFF